MEPEQNVQNLEKIKIDLIVVGNSNSGKTSLIKRFVNGQKGFVHTYQPSLGLSLEKKEVVIDNYQVSVQIWDTAGQQKFFSITQNYFKKADGILVIFDMTDKSSFDRINKFWIQEIKDKATEDSTQIILGNKSDLAEQRTVSYEMASEMAGELNLKYFETSAKTGENIEEAITYIVKECIKKIRTNQATGVTLVNEPQRQSSCFSNPKQFLSNLLSKLKNKEQQ